MTDTDQAIQLFHTLSHGNDPKFMDRAIVEYNRIVAMNSGPELGKFLVDLRARWDTETPGTPAAMEIQDMLHEEGPYKKG